MFRNMFRLVCERLRVVAAFSEGRGEGCVWRASKDLIFFSRLTCGYFIDLFTPFQK